MLGLPINFFQLLELHQVSVDLVLLERFIVHREKGNKSQEIIKRSFLFSEGCGTKEQVLGMEHNID